MPTDISSSVMIYEIKSPPVVQENYKRLLSRDRQRFYWNEKMFGNLNLGDHVFVINPSTRNVLFTKLDKTGITAHYDRERDQSTFTDGDA